MATFKKFATNLIVAMLLSFVTSVTMAASGLPMLKTSVASGVEYAQRLLTGQEVNGSAILVAQALKRANRIENVSVAEAAEYLRQGEVRTCPSGVRTLSAVWGGSKLGTVSRAYRANEMCLWDRNAGIWIGSLTCGNIDMEVGPDAIPLAEEGGSLQGPEGEQGPPGRDGRDGVDGRDGREYVGGQVLDYEQGTETRMSDRGRVETTQVIGGILNTAIMTYGATKIFDKLSRRWVQVEQIRATRGPSHVTVIGNCNGVLGGRANCVTNPTQIVQGPVGPPGPPGHDGPPGHPGRPGDPAQPPPPPDTRPPPQEPIIGPRPHPSEPVIGPRPRPSEPIGGSGFLPPRQNPGEGTIGPRARPQGPGGG